MIPVYGFQKTTLLDFPGQLACTIFVGHCNLRCPFCHNASLLVPSTNTIPISWDSIQEHLIKRRSILQGVCITGGEPTLHKELPAWIATIKSLGYLVKLDTNGTNPAMLQALLEQDLLAMVAMDVKNSPANYGVTVGRPQVDLAPIQESVELLKQSSIRYEFRTTLVREFHTKEDLLQIGEWLQGDSFYYLQNYKHSADVLQETYRQADYRQEDCRQDGQSHPRLHGFADEELEEMRAVVLPYLKNTFIR